MTHFHESWTDATYQYKAGLNCEAGTLGSKYAPFFWFSFDGPFT